MAKEEAALRNWTAFTRAYSTDHQDWLELAERCNDFYLGKQWDSEDAARLREENRPYLTLNQILQVVNAVRGHYSTTRADVVFKPKKGGATSDVAQTLTRLFDGILDANDFAAKEARVFEDGLIEDRGYFDVRISFDENVLGEVEIKTLDPRTVVLDPDAQEYDPSTWSEVFVTRWMSPEDLELYYGKKAKDRVLAVAATMDTFGERSMRFDTFGGDFPHTGLSSFPDDEKAIRSVRVIERQYRRMAKRREFVDLATGEARPVPETWDEERIEAVKLQYNLVTRERMVKRIRWTVSADSVTIFDDWSPYDHFTVVPYFPMFRRGNPSGLVRHMLDPQEQLNKIESQVLHVINTTANSGWVLEAGSLVNMTEDELEERGAETGLVLVHGKGRSAPQKIKPNTMPTGLEAYSGKALSYIQSIPGVAALLGQMPSPEVSGVALQSSQNRALLGLQVCFDNLDVTRGLLAKVVLNLIQKFYTEGRVYSVLDWRNPEQTQEEVAINQEIAGEIVNNVTLGEYFVQVSSAPARDTFEDTQFAQAIELRNAGVMIPDHHVIAASHLAGKRQIAEEVKNLQGLGEPNEMQQMQAQLQMQIAQLSVEEAAAKVAKIQAEAAALQAKAQTMVAGEQREMQVEAARLDLEAQRLKADLAKKAADLQTKIELAQVHTGTKQQLTRYTTLMKDQMQERKLNADAEKQNRQLIGQQIADQLNQAAVQN